MDVVFPEAYREAMMLGALVLLACSQVPGKPSISMEPGAVVRLVAPKGDVPALRDEVAFRRFIAAARHYRSEEFGSAEGEAAIQGLWPDRLRLLPSGFEAQVIAIHRGRRWPVPAAHLSSGLQRFWVPLAYVEGRDGDGVRQFPELSVEYRDPTAGDETVLVGTRSDSMVPVARDQAAFREYLKAQIAGDDDGKKTLRRDGRAFLVSDGTPVLVRAFHREIPGLAPEAVEFRILDGPKKGAIAWVPVANLKPTRVKGLSIAMP